MPTSKKGSESTWHVARRCLAMLRRVQQGPATKRELLAAVYASEGEEAYDRVTGENLTKRFDNDKLRLWDRLHIRIRYDKRVKGYVIAEIERPLLDLPDSHLETLAFLADTFQPDSPNAPQVQQLVDSLLSWLSGDRRTSTRRRAACCPT